jgi:hypothetical protein
MAFERLTTAPARADLLDGPRLSRISTRQYNAWLKQWRMIHAKGGIWHMEFAGDFVLGDLRERIDKLRSHVGHPEHEDVFLERNDRWKTLRRVGQEAVAGMAIAGLFATEDYLPRAQQGYSYPSPKRSAGVDLDFREIMPKPIAMLHERIAVAEEILPGFDRAVRDGRYIDGAVVINTRVPALPTTAFLDTFRGVSGGQEFDAASHVTLRPQLLASYVELPAT